MFWNQNRWDKLHVIDMCLAVVHLPFLIYFCLNSWRLSPYLVYLLLPPITSQNEKALKRRTPGFDKLGKSGFLLSGLRVAFWIGKAPLEKENIEYLPIFSPIVLKAVSVSHNPLVSMCAECQIYRCKSWRVRSLFKASSSSYLEQGLYFERILA